MDLQPYRIFLLVDNPLAPRIMDDHNNCAQLPRRVQSNHGDQPADRCEDVQVYPREYGSNIATSIMLEDLDQDRIPWAENRILTRWPGRGGGRATIPSLGTNCYIGAQLASASPRRPPYH